MATLSFCNLCVGYAQQKHNQAIIGEQWNAILAPHALTTLVGENGTGKSTLLKTLSGILPPLSGEVLINGKSLYDMSVKERAKLVGVVLSGEQVNENMNVFEFVSLGRYPYTNYFGTLRTKDKDCILFALERMEVAHLVHKKLQHLSDGERQKVHIAKVLAQETPIVVMDEPTSHLDYPSKKALMKHLLMLTKEENKTVLLSSHDLHVALLHTQHLWLIDEERRLCSGKVDDFSENKLLKKWLQND